MILETKLLMDRTVYNNTKKFRHKLYVKNGSKYAINTCKPLKKFNK